MSYMSELVECREALRSRPQPSIWQRALQGGSIPVVEETPSLAEFGQRPGKAERDWYETIGVAASMELWPPGWAEDRLEALEEPETCPDCGSGIFEDTDGEPRCAGCMEILSLDVELVAPGIVDLTNDPLIMGILAGDIRTLCLDCSERDCPAHPVNGIV